MAAEAGASCQSLSTSNDRKKVLLLGKNRSGVHSIMRAIFSDKTFQKIDSTNDIYCTKLLYFDNIISLWNCEGNHTKMNIYVQKKRQMVCQNVDTLVYVFDVQSQGDEWIEEMIEFRSCLRIIFENSSAPKVVWLLHKIDLIPIENRENVFLARRKEIKSVCKLENFVCYTTSIWDDSLFKAWSLTFRSFIPKINKLDIYVQQFGNSMNAHKVLLIDNFTLLVISHYNQVPIEVIDCYASLSAVLRQFQRSRSNEITVKWTSEQNEHFRIVIRNFMKNSYLLGVFPDLKIPSPTIDASCKRFEELDDENLVDKFFGNLGLNYNSRL